MARQTSLQTFRLLFLAWLIVAISPGAFAQTGAVSVPDCNDPDTHDINCTEPTPAIVAAAREAGYPYYIGHAEPTTLFFSTAGASGNNMRWKFKLPATEPASPTQNGSSVANFELYSTFWLGLALCDPNSNPFGPCVATSDANNPSTAGAAFLELQFYPPGLNCSNTQWCVSLHINTLQNFNTFQQTNCLEPTTQAYVTTNGMPGDPQLLMTNGDTMVVTIQDTANGLETDVNDQTSWTTGSMVASGANGFVHNANQSTCATTPFDFHAMYATASPGQVVPWATLGPNVAFDFEIGHFELCGDSGCATKPDGSDTDDTGCQTVRGIGGCFGSDLDHDGTPYQADWPDGTAAHPASVILGAPNDQGVGPLNAATSGSSTYDQAYDTITFQTTEADDRRVLSVLQPGGHRHVVPFQLRQRHSGHDDQRLRKGVAVRDQHTQPVLSGSGSHGDEEPHRSVHAGRYRRHVHDYGLEHRRSRNKRDGDRRGRAAGIVHRDRDERQRLDLHGRDRDVHDGERPRGRRVVSADYADGRRCRQCADLPSTR